MKEERREERSSWSTIGWWPISPGHFPLRRHDTANRCCPRPSVSPCREADQAHNLLGRLGPVGLARPYRGTHSHGHLRRACSLPSTERRFTRRLTVATVHHYGSTWSTSALPRRALTHLSLLYDVWPATDFAAPAGQAAKRSCWF